ncbi:glutaredoxin 2 [Cricetibacter osteomyelitidis]|uniref:Glutaredoxin 2 n=1 Tax=Cricetibacter osteomyelitidis TaxID=1521931 RepID=A0A4R2SQ78_9PAST|nr:GrxB family glutaredoxin [Cricetibacter osteomyelitidis]TCP91245.1 glutaredoxin 2 [Cricetibacter osteomyelitidis]
MKLYVYDHCPFCVRARMIFGLKNVPVEELAILNDDEVTPIGLVGKKMVPILVKEDGTAMPESLDIVKYIDENYAGDKTQNWLSSDIRPEIENWLKTVSEYTGKLVGPRYVKINLPEFATQSAIDYFVYKKQQSYGNFAENLENTASYLAHLHKDLETLEPLIQGEYAAGHPSLEDIILFPVLRNFTCVKGVHFPTKVAQYVEKMAELSKINLYTNQAI